MLLVRSIPREAVDSSVVGNDYTKEYVLDLVGNRTKLVETKEGQSPVTTTYTYNARDQLLNESDGTSTIIYGYDSNGSLTSQSSPSSSRTQIWDLRGRLSGATVDGVTTSYRYTPDGIRSSVTENGSTVEYLIDGMTPSGYAQVVEELPSGVFAVRYTYGASLDPISETRSGTTSLYLGDGHSGVRQAISLAAAIVLAQRFDAFGGTIVKNGSLQTPIGYRGERFDPTLGQYYLRARFYDPNSDRFTGVDPFPGNMSDPLQLMRYGYAGINPISRMDPSGKWSIGATIGSIAISTAMTTIVSGLFEPILGRTVPLLIPGSVLNFLETANENPVFVYGLNIGAMAGINGLAGVGAVGGAELLVSTITNNAVPYMFRGASSGIGFEGQLKTILSIGVAVTPKVGMVFGLKRGEDYEGPFWSVTVPFKYLPQKMKNLVTTKLPDAVSNGIKLGEVISKVATTIGNNTGYRKPFEEQVIPWLKKMQPSVSRFLDNIGVTVFWDPNCKTYGFSIDWNIVGNTGKIGTSSTDYSIMGTIEARRRFGSTAF